MNPNSKEFKALQEKWYKKAADSGFKDIEEADGKLKFWDSNYFSSPSKPARLAGFESKQEYFRLAGNFLAEYKFSNSRDRLIWDLHSQGLSIREIVVELKKRTKKGFKREVHEKIRELIKIMFATYKVTNE